MEVVEHISVSPRSAKANVSPWFGTIPLSQIIPSTSGDIFNDTLTSGQHLHTERPDKNGIYKQERIIEN